MNELFIAVFSLLNFYRTLKYKLVVDDVSVYDNWRKLREEFRQGKVSIRKRHPIKKAIYHLHRFIRAYSYGGAGYWDAMWLDHLITLSLHTITCILIYKAFGNNIQSLMVSLVYCIHPMQTQTSVWLNGRRYSLAVMLTCIIWWFKPWGIILYPFMPLFHFMGLPIIFAVAFSKYYWIILIAIYSAFKFRNKFNRWYKARRIPVLEVMNKWHPKKLIIMTKTLGYYFWRAFVPNGVYFYTSFMQTYLIDNLGNKEAFGINKDFWAGVCSILALTCLIVTGHYWFVWWLLFIAMWTNWKIFTMVVADRYSSIANIGLFLGTTHILYNTPYGMYLYVAWLTYLLTVFHKEVDVYEDIDVFLLRHCDRYPKTVASSLFLTKSLIKVRDYYRAFVYNRTCYEHNKDDYRIIYRMAFVCTLMGYLVEAKQFFNKLLPLANEQTFEGKEKTQGDLNNLYEMIEAEEKRQKEKK